MGMHAQYDAQFSQYYMATSYYNPAYAGVNEDLNLLAMHRQQWVGIEGAPKSFLVNADMPLNFGSSKLGAGMILFTESIGLFQNTHVAGQLSYKNSLFGGTLSVGLQLGIANNSFDGSKAIPPSGEGGSNSDLAIPTNQVEAMALDVNVGVFYTLKQFYIGIGAMHLTKPELMLEENVYTYIGSSYNLTGGYNIKLNNPLFELQPSVFLKTDTRSFQTDITGRIKYSSRFNGGLTWRVNESVVALLGATFGDIEVGYSYDFPTTPILKGSTGSHELMVKYKLKLKKSRSGKNKHKSVRIL
jgi:Bacteroidetes-specific putative membrane protein